MFERRRVRSLLFRIHTWLGLHLCILFAVIFATGTLLMFSPELINSNRPDLWIKPVDASAPAATVGQIYDSIEASQDGVRIDTITSTQRPWFGRAVIGSSPERGYLIHVHPQTAEVIGFGGGWPLRTVIRQIHDSLLIQFKLGDLAVTFLSFVVLTMAISGLVTYRRFWRGYFRLPSKDAEPRARRAAWHRLAGVWVAPFLIASALGSAVFFANDIGWEGKFPETAPISERAERLPAGFNGTTLDGLVDLCREEMPTFADTTVRFPGWEGAPLRIDGYDTRRWSLLGSVWCVVDPATGKVTEMIAPSDNNAALTVTTIATIIHYGIWGGWLSLILWALFGLGSVMLAITGAQVYASRIAQADATGEAPRGTWRLVVRGLGVFKWAYALLVLGMIATLAYLATSM